MSEKGIRSLKAEKLNHRKLIDTWVNDARKQCKPICISCANLDAAKNRLKDKEEYMKGLTEVRRNNSMVREHGSKNETPVASILIDYKCPYGHGVSVHYRKDEYVESGKKSKMVKE